MGCDIDYAWAAGFIDGEGYLALQPIHKRRSDGFVNRKPRIEVSQIDLEPLEKLKDIFGGYVLKLVKRENRRQAYRWEIVGAENVKSTLEKILPYLTVKKAQAEVLLEFIGYMKPRDQKGWTVTMAKDSEIKRTALQDRLLGIRRGGSL